MVIELDSSTVFWTDLGITEKQLVLIRSNYVVADRIWKPMIDWIEENALGDTRSHYDGVWFARSIDAIAFKMTFAGEINV